MQTCSRHKVDKVEPGRLVSMHLHLGGQADTPSTVAA